MDRKHVVGGGGMTGATGDLTPDDAQEEFVPGETREAGDPRSHADVTVAQGRDAPAQRGEARDPSEMPEGGLTNLTTRDDGYGSTQGLAPDDPAYRMETRVQPRDPAPHESREPRIGGDTISDSEERL
jgi:hypothetical protein